MVQQANRVLRENVSKLSGQIQALDKKFSEKPPRRSLKISTKCISLRKAILDPGFKNKTVLTDSTWRYVEIFLKEQKADEALFYWEQANNFYQATKSLSLISAPLTSYYTFLNATKAMLTFKKIGFDTRHGVSGHREDGQYNLQNEHIVLKTKGIAASLSKYLDERIPENGAEYNLKKILFNLPYIHRAYHLTYGGSELFVPIVNPRFVYDKTRQKAWFEAQLEAEHSSKNVLNKLIGFGIDNWYDNSEFFTIRRNKTFMWDAPRNSPTEQSKKALKNYHRKIRSQVTYIYSPSDLWYIKRKSLNNNAISRSTLPLTFIAMHRLSELARYNPQTLKKHFERKASWLLTEFINKSMYQFIDQISSEITGDDFRLTGFRT